MLNRFRTIAGDGFTADPTESFTPDAEFYFDPQIHAAELNTIFGRNWLYFCHQSQVPEIGDYLTGEAAGQSIYVIRGRDG